MPENKTKLKLAKLVEDYFPEDDYTQANINDIISFIEHLDSEGEITINKDKEISKGTKAFLDNFTLKELKGIAKSMKEEHKRDEFHTLNHFTDVLPLLTFIKVLGLKQEFLEFVKGYINLDIGVDSFSHHLGRFERLFAGLEESLEKGNHEKLIGKKGLRKKVEEMRRDKK
jgi:hypothetical protein